MTEVNWGNALVAPTPLRGEPDCGAWSELFQRRFGLALRDSQVPAVMDLVRSRVASRGLPTWGAYYDLLDAEPEDGPEWTELVERLVSHETSFFRHPPSFEALRARILPDLRRRPHVGGNLLSLWSAGCSTGEEAYSLAMVARADTADGEDFMVWGADISRRSIDAARRGCYSERAVTAVPAMYRQQFLRSVSRDCGRCHEISGDLRQRVRFVASNLYAGAGFYLCFDVIFCQNVLIYFAPAAVPRLLATLGSRLSIGGYLVLGPGEAPSESPVGLEPVNVQGVRAFRRVGRTAREVRT